MTRQSAFIPQDPWQGSWHFLFIHALFDGQSILLTHSARQFGGAPIKFGAHIQTGLSPSSLQCEFGPQGEGKHGLILIGASGAVDKKKKKLKIKQQFY